MLKLITDKHETSRGLSATAELLVIVCFLPCCSFWANKDVSWFCFQWPWVSLNLDFKATW